MTAGAIIDRDRALLQKSEIIARIVEALPSSNGY